MQANHIPFIDLAYQALAGYDLKDYTLEFIRHSDNLTFKVDGADSRAYLLRIHVPVTQAMGTHGADADMVHSELLWLEALSQETDLVLQTPVRNRAGKLVTQVNHAAMGSPVNCTLLRWIEGQPYLRDLETEQTAHQIGAIVAKLHNHASHWEIPEGFTRPKRDLAYFQEALKGIQPAVTDGRISASAYAEYETAIRLLSERLPSLDENRQNYGLMHADLHKGNMLYQDGKIRLIDFSFCAFGNFMFDLGICLSDMKANLHSAFLESYRSLRVLPEDYPWLIEAFFLGSIVGAFSFWAANPRLNELLVTQAARVASDKAASFNRGEHFWFN